MLEVVEIFCREEGFKEEGMKTVGTEDKDRQPASQTNRQTNIRSILRIRIRARESSLHKIERLPCVTDGLHGTKTQYVECAVAVVPVG